ncbi:hypothetical protein CCR81_00930 [Halorhodospira halophila]|nr:hypothetical protein [Halorhodospira halophila]
MHIVHLVARPMPPPSPADAGGMPQLITWLAEAQTRSGDQVTVVSPRGHDTAAYRHVQPTAWEPAAVLAALPGDADVIHLHGENPELCGLASPLGDWPRVTTVHGNHQGRELPLPNRIYVSRDHARRHGAERFVYNGLPLEQFPFAEGRQRRGLLFLGKLRRSKKGAKAAVRIARAAREPLALAGQPTWKLPASRLPWWPGITALGAVHGDAKTEALARARALLFPAGWDEPFGLVLIEAMACGTPVIGSRRGALPEVVADGETGFLCDTEAEMVDAIQAVGALDHRACRDHVQRYFDIDRVRQDYAHFYAAAIAGERW